VLLQSLLAVKNLSKKLAGSDQSEMLQTNDSRDSDVHNQEDCPLWCDGDSSDNAVHVADTHFLWWAQTITVDTDEYLRE
jgi:hypothetical protein